MVKKQKFNIPFTSIAILIIVLAFISMLLIILASKQKKEINTEQETIPYGQTVYVTPTIIPNKDKMKFIHPQNHFSFEYPSNWQIVMGKQTIANEDWYSVMLTNDSNNNEFKINFMVNGRGYPRYLYEEEENKLLGNINTKWTTLYNESRAFETIISFPENNFNQNLIGLYIYLPEENQEEFIKEVEEIITSLK